MADDTVTAGKGKRGRYRKPGCKEVTTRMPVDLADAVRQVARGHGMSINEFIIAAMEAAVSEPSVRPSAAHAKASARRALQAALAQLEPEEDLPASA